MNWNEWLPLLVIISSLVPGLIIFALPEEKIRLRTTLNIFGAVVKLVLVAWMLWGVYNQTYYETRLALLPDLDLVLRAGPLALNLITNMTFPHKILIGNMS